MNGEGQAAFAYRRLVAAVGLAELLCPAEPVHVILRPVGRHPVEASEEGAQSEEWRELIMFLIKMSESS